MKFVLLFVMPLVCIVAEPKPKLKTVNGVYIIDRTNYAMAIHVLDKYITHYHASWNKESMKVIPEMEKAAVVLKKIRPKAKVCRFDCTEDEQFCEYLEVRTYPTLTFTEKGSIFDFGDKPTAENILENLVNVTLRIHYD